MDKIVIIDLGGQYCHLIARRIRDLGVYAEIKDENYIPKDKKIKGLILSGGPNSVIEPGAPTVQKEIFELDIPVLGICYGHQLMAHLLEGKVESGTIKEYGIAKINILDNNGIFQNLDQQQTVWMSHGDSIKTLPSGFHIIATSEECKVAAMGNPKKKQYGVQFHPEVTHTPNGYQMLSNFLDICKCNRTWKIENFIADKMAEIQITTKNKKILFLVSGGVDSTVAFSLATRTLGQKAIHGLHIDNGLMRMNETKMVKEALQKLRFNNLQVVNASKEFLKALRGIADPEEKRKVIGEEFINIFQRELAKLPLSDGEWLLGQGTIYPDTIESQGTRHSDLIKTHHNRVEIIQQMIEEGKVFEPIAQLYKDEVRELGLKLGLPPDLIFRHPFPGPGLGVRCLCIDKSETIPNLKVIQKKINNVCLEFGFSGIILPIRSVGVQGDARTYKYPAMIYGGEKDWNLIEMVSTAITNRVPEINRVVLLLNTPQPLLSDLTVRENKFITEERLNLLRECDYQVTKRLNQYNKLPEISNIWQNPIVLLPLGLRSSNQTESIVLRPVYSKEAMTAQFARVPFVVVEEIVKDLQKLESIDLILYDVTHKPPGTIEWE
ncbi:MAG: glutamine-hydrolyzing GMP synthase [Candidatus Hermodarchaeota archaeon]